MKASDRSRFAGHCAALFTVLVWGCTFVSSKILLTAFNSIEILFLRFALGFILLLLMRPRFNRPKSLLSELYFVGAGLTGVTGYYLLENLSLTMTPAAIVSVITCAAPFFTALFAGLFLKEKTLTPFFFIGFVVSIAGVCLLSLFGSQLTLDPLGTVLAIAATMCWGFYSVLVKKASETGMDTICMTRRFFFYGLLFMLPFMKVMGFAPDMAQLLQAKYLLNMLFLGMIACAVCFVTWTFALARLGTVEASVYIYLTPVITVVASYIVLGERITGVGYIGIALTLLGLVISEFKPKKDVSKGATI